MRLALRFAVLCALPSAGCWSSQTLSPGNLRSAVLEAGDSADTLLIDKVGPNSFILLNRADGSQSWPQTGRQLRANRDGITMRGTRDLNEASEAVVVGLDERSYEILASTCPSMAKLQAGEGQEWHLLGDGPSLKSWVDEFARQVSLEFAPAAPDSWCVKRTATGAPLTDYASDREERVCTLGKSEEWAEAFMRSQLRGRPLGTWRFRYAPRHWSNSHDGKGLLDALALGMEMDVGWPWETMQSVEVFNLDGPKTLLAIYGFMALGLATGGAKADLGPGLEAPVDPWRAELLGSGDEPARAMFSRSYRRRTAYSVLVATGVAFSLRGQSSDVTLGVRFAGHADMGLVVGRTWREGINKNYNCFRLGAHLPIDLPERVALYTNLDLCSSFPRMQIGLRYQFSKKLFAGVAVGATYNAFDIEIPAGLELSAAF